MQDYDPKWSINEAIDYLTRLSKLVTILDLCLEQIAEIPEPCLSRLHYLIGVVRSDIDCFSDDGLFKAKLVRDFLYQNFPDEGNRLEPSQSSEANHHAT